MAVALLTDSTTIVAIPDVLSSAFEYETVLLDLRDGVYYTLDEVGARIWQLVQRPVSIPDICKTIRTEFEVAAERCDEDVRALAHNLLDRGLVRVESSG